MTHAVRLTRLPLPISKNALRRSMLLTFRRGGKTIHVPKTYRPKKVKLRTDLIVAEIWRQLGGRLHAPIFTGPCSISWTLTPRDRRSIDRQNYFEHLADCLQEAKVVENDRLLVHEVSELMPVTEAPGWVDVTVEGVP